MSSAIYSAFGYLFDLLHLQRAQDVESLLQLVKPCGCTYIGMKLEVVLSEYCYVVGKALIKGGGDWDYVRRMGIKPLNVIVITDGEPSKLMRTMKHCNALMTDYLRLAFFR